MIDTAVVIPCYNKPGRPHTLNESFKHLLKQRLDVLFVIVELCFDDADISDITEGSAVRIKIQGEDKHKDLFQKESLLNIGFKYIDEHYTEIKYLIFLDADVYCEDDSWFGAIRGKLFSNPNKVVQVYSSFQDTGDTGRITYSDAFLRQHCIDVKKANKPIKENSFISNPGIGYGVSFAKLKEFGWLNNASVLGEGDYLFVREMCFNGFHSTFKTNRSLFYDRHQDKIWRYGIASGLLDYVDYHIKHIYHGEYNHRCYLGRRFAMGFWNRERDEITPTGEDGLRYWKDPECDERKVTSQYLACKVHNETAYNSYQLYEDIGYQFDRNMPMKIGMCILDDENRVIDIREMFNIPDLSHHDPREQPLIDGQKNMNLRVDLDGSKDRIVCKQLDSTGQCQIGVANWLEDQELNQYYRYVMISSDMNPMINRVSFIPNKDGVINLILRSDYKVNYCCYLDKIDVKGCKLLNPDFEILQMEDGLLSWWHMENKDSLVTNFSKHGKNSVRLTHDDFISQDMEVKKDEPVELVFYHRCLI